MMHQQRVNSDSEKLSFEDIDLYLKKWNQRFPYDRLWRKKYKIAFGSLEHLSINQIDIFLDIREDLLEERLKKQRIKFLKEKEEYEQKGVMFKESILSPEEEEKVWKKIKLPNKDV